MQNQAGNVCSSIYGKEMITIGLGEEGGDQREVGRIERNPARIKKAGDLHWSSSDMRKSWVYVHIREY
jgi:hypothetical protein